MTTVNNSSDFWDFSKDECVEEEKKPLEPYIFTQEPTIEGLYKLLSSGQPSMCLNTDEGGQFIGGHALKAENELRSLTFFSKLWDGKPINRIRSLDGSSRIKDKRLSLHLMIQPAVALGLFSNKLAREQGFLSRCLIAYPESKIGLRKYSNVNLSQSSIIKSFYSKCNKILDIKFEIQPGTLNDLCFRHIKLDDAAKIKWVLFHDQTEVRMQKNEDLFELRGFASKIAEICLRLSASIALYENPNAQFINVDHISCGIKLMEYYTSEAKRLIGVAKQNPELEVANKLHIWLIKKTYVQFKLKDIYQLGPSELRDAESAKKAVKILEHFGWVKKLPNGLGWELLAEESQDVDDI